MKIDAEWDKTTTTATNSDAVVLQACSLFNWLLFPKKKKKQKKQKPSQSVLYLIISITFKSSFVGFSVWCGLLKSALSAMDLNILPTTMLKYCEVRASRCVHEINDTILPTGCYFLCRLKFLQINIETCIPISVLKIKVEHRVGKLITTAWSHKYAVKYQVSDTH